VPGLIVTDESGTLIVYGVPPAEKEIVELLILSVTGEEPTPETFITPLNQSAEPADMAVPLKFADIEELQPDVVVDMEVRGGESVADCINGGIGAPWPALQPASTATSKAAGIRIRSVDMVEDLSKMANRMARAGRA
jgi:hypothetical protein